MADIDKSFWLPAAQPLEVGSSKLAVIVAIPFVFLVTGLCLRYAAFASLPSDDGYGLGAYVTSLCHWDCGWYTRMVREGYESFPMAGRTNVGSWGFFPLYPIIVWGLVSITGLAILPVATMASTALTFTACLISWPLLDRNIRAYTLYCALLLSGPFSYHYATFLTEPLYILLMSCVFLALKRSNFLVAGICSAFLSATRIVGVFIVFATVLKMFEDFRRSGGRAAGFLGHLLGRPDLLLAIFISPLGLFAFMFYLKQKVGDGLAFAHVQRAFGRYNGNPALYLWDGLLAFQPTTWLPSDWQWSALAVLVALGLTAVLAWRGQYGAALFCAICILLPLSAGLSSIIRYMSALAPLGMTLAALLAKSRILFAAGLLLFLTSCYFLTLAWIQANTALV